MDFEAIMELCGRATQLHHEYTAPLTGAYGGTYNLTESEADTSLYEPIGREREARKEAFLVFLYAGVAGLIRPKDERLQALRRVGGALTLMQSGNAPSDGELRAYLDFLPESRQFLRKRSQLEEALRDRILAKNGSLDDVENYIEQADKAYRQVNGFWSKLGKSVFLGAGAAVGGAGCGFVAAGMGFFSTVLKTAAEKAAEVVIPKSLERFVSKRNDAKQIVRVLDTLGS